MLFYSLLVWKASLVAFMVFQAADAKATVKIYLGTFTAPYYVKCDVFGPCDFKFKFCVDKLNSGRRMAPCTYLSKTTGALGRSPINLGSMSPLIIPINHWEGGLDLKVQAMDYDRFSHDDVVDNLRTNYLSPTIGTSTTRTMQTRTKLTVTFTSSCDQNYYGPYCEILCIPQNDILKGHYKCDSLTGQEVCLSGWQGAGCHQSKHATTNSTTPPSSQSTTQYEADTTPSLSKAETVSPSTDENLTPSSATSFATNESQVVDITTPFEDIDKYGDNSSSNSSKVPYKWFCGTTILASMEDNETRADDEFSMIIAKMLNSLSEYPNSTLVFNSNRSRICNGSDVFALLLEYCLLGTSEDQWRIEELIKKEYIQVLNPEINLVDDDCIDESHDHRATADRYQSKNVLWGVATSVTILVFALGFLFYYSSKHCERRKREGATVDCRLSYKSQGTCRSSSDDATLIAVNCERHLSVENVNCRNENFYSEM